MKRILPLLSSIIIIALIANCNFKRDEAAAEQESITLNQTELAAYTIKGKELATATQKVLGGNLKAAIQTKGTEHALEFCNVKAYPLTDSMAVELNAAIKRVSDKPRNAANTANEDQLEYIKKVKATLTKGEEVTPETKLIGDRVTSYYPIITNDLCMQCHGKPDSQINKTTLAKIQTLYPADQATGYNAGELRGIWVIEQDVRK